MTLPLVQIKNLSLRYGDFIALNDISVDFMPETCVVICGPSGSGKSSLLRCVNRLEEFDSGDVIFDGESLKNAKNISQIRSNIGMVFQHFELYPHLSILNNITLAPQKVNGVQRNEAEEKAYEVAELLKLSAMLNKKPDELSGGQQQRVALARALSMEPKIMLFDEPTSALIPK